MPMPMPGSAATSSTLTPLDQWLFAIVAVVGPQRHDETRIGPTSHQDPPLTSNVYYQMIIDYTSYDARQSPTSPQDPPTARAGRYPRGAVKVGADRVRRQGLRRCVDP